MSVTITGTLFDGETLAPRAITLEADGAQLSSRTEGIALEVPLAALRASDRLAALPRFLYLPGGRTLETPDNDVVDALLAAQQRGRLVAAVHWLERHARTAAVATVLLVAITAATVWWGLPVLARQVAFAVPDSVEQQAGRTALATLNRLLAPTQLDLTGRSRVQAQLDRLHHARPLPVRPTVVFRSMGGSYPNAFALPGGTIVVSDELVTLVTNDELAAVLAHEIGHWQLRHGLQGVLRNSAALLVVSAVTGDLTAITTFAGTLPLALLQRGYSREFETEADTYAVELLRQARIDPAHFAAALKKLEDARPKKGRDLTYLSTHPATADRIKRINPDGHVPAPTVTKLESLTLARPDEALSAFSKPVDFQARHFEKHPDVRPSALKVEPPVYPSALSARSVEGNVVVEFIIDPQGNVRDPRVIRSTHRAFEEPALTAVRQWQFTPGRKNGRPVATLASQSIEFSLNSPPPAAATPSEKPD